jgi:hypothetical protein
VSEIVAGIENNCKTYHEIYVKMRIILMADKKAN